MAEPIPPAAAIDATPRAPGTFITSLNKRTANIVPDAPIG